MRPNKLVWAEYHTDGRRRFIAAAVVRDDPSLATIRLRVPTCADEEHWVEDAAVDWPRPMVFRMDDYYVQDVEFGDEADQLQAQTHEVGPVTYWGRIVSPAKRKTDLDDFVTDQQLRRTAAIAGVRS